MKRFRFGGGDEVENMNMANVLMLLSRGGGGGGGGGRGRGGGEESEHSAQTSPGRVFECKTCNRQFPSFQALGGHRASHKKPRLVAEGQLQGGLGKPRVHECSICGLEFAIGQALGGHMRRHRAGTEGFGHGLAEKKPEGRRVLSLDLNLPPSENDIECRKIGFGLEIVDKIPMVDCLH